MKLVLFHILHFFGIGKFYRFRLIIPNFSTFTDKAYKIDAYSFRKDVEKTIRKNIYKHYGRIGLMLYKYEILEIY